MEHSYDLQLPLTLKNEIILAAVPAQAVLNIFVLQYQTLLFACNIAIHEKWYLWTRYHHARHSCLQKSPATHLLKVLSLLSNLGPWLGSLDPV